MRWAYPGGVRMADRLGTLEKAAFINMISASTALRCSSMFMRRSFALSCCAVIAATAMLNMFPESPICLVTASPCLFAMCVSKSWSMLLTSPAAIGLSGAAPSLRISASRRLKCARRVCSSPGLALNCALR